MTSGHRRPSSGTSQRRKGLEAKVKRIVVDIDTQDIGAAKRFYQDVLGLELLMAAGWIATYGSSEAMTITISFAPSGGPDTPPAAPTNQVEHSDPPLQGRSTPEK